MTVAIRETAWRPFASNCKAVSLILGLLLLSYPRPAQSAVPAGGAELNRLRISIPGLGSSSYPLIMAQKKRARVIAKYGGRFLDYLTLKQKIGL